MHTIDGPYDTKNRLIKITNSKGSSISALLSTSKKNKLAIVCSGLGICMRRMQLPTLYYLANGFDVLRFDPTNSDGESDGKIEDFTLTNVFLDMQDVLDYVRHNLNYENIVIFASSMSCRAAIRLGYHRKNHISAIDIISGIINVQRSIELAAGEDLVGKTRIGKIENYEETGNIIKNEIKYSSLLDVLENRWDSLHVLKHEIEESKSIRFKFIYGEKDPWIEHCDIEELRKLAVDVSYIYNAVHELNFVSAKIAFHQLINHHHTSSQSFEPTDVAEPTFGSLLSLSKIDKLLLSDGDYSHDKLGN